MKKPNRKGEPPGSGVPDDPLVDEVRRIRAQISEQHGHDLERMFEDLRKVQQEYGGKVIHKRGKRTPA
jgi:hypothetical protein